MRCKATATVRHVWANGTEEKTCAVHSKILNKMANHFGLHLQLIPLPVEPVVQCDHEVWT